MVLLIAENPLVALRRDGDMSSHQGKTLKLFGVMLDNTYSKWCFKCEGIGL